MTSLVFSSLPNEPQADTELTEDKIENTLKIVNFGIWKMNFDDATILEQSMKYVVRQAKIADEACSKRQSY